MKAASNQGGIYGVCDAACSQLPASTSYPFQHLFFAKHPFFETTEKNPVPVPFRGSHLGLSASKSKLGPKPTPAGQVLGNLQSDVIIPTYPDNKNRGVLGGEFSQPFRKSTMFQNGNGFSWVHGVIFPICCGKSNHMFETTTLGVFRSIST